jgi:hypothetical protein
MVNRRSTPTRDPGVTVLHMSRPVTGGRIEGQAASLATYIGLVAVLTLLIAAARPA